MHMRYLFLLTIAGLMFSAPVQADEINAGFVQGLWYSSETVLEGEPTRIYVALRNNTDHDLTGTVRFSVDGTRIGSSEVRALSGRLVEAWVDWSPKSGNHTVLANVSNAELHIIGEGTQRIDITSMVAEDQIFVDIDTDGDGVGNETDTDDDGDGLSDEEETSGGTDPLKPDQTPAVPSQEETDTEQEPTSIDTEIPTDPESGLEKFLSEGTADDVFSAVTKRIENTKKSLDEYRESRIEKPEEPAPVQSTISEPTDTATITRTQVEPNVGFFEKFISLTGSLISTLWSFTLVFFSFLLGFPALIELLILWGILVLLYKTAKRLGQRRRP